jgi:hypothetical protein
MPGGAVFSTVGGSVDVCALGCVVPLGGTQLLAAGLNTSPPVQRLTKPILMRQVMNWAGSLLVTSGYRPSGIVWQNAVAAL